MNVCCVFANLGHYDNVGLCEINLKTGHNLKHRAANLTRDLWGSVFKAFVASSCVRFEGGHSVHETGNVLLYAFFDRIKVFFNNRSTAYGNDTENLSGKAKCLVDICIVVFRLDINRALRCRNSKISRKLQSFLKLAQKELFKMAFVKSFEDYLAIFTK